MNLNLFQTCGVPLLCCVVCVRGNNFTTKINPSVCVYVLCCVVCVRGNNFVTKIDPSVCVPVLCCVCWKQFLSNPFLCAACAVELKRLHPFIDLQTYSIKGYNRSNTAIHATHMEGLERNTFVHTQHNTWLMDCSRRRRSPRR